MALHVLRDPRRYLLAAMAVAITVVVPLLFAFVTMMDHVFGPDSSIIWVVLWVLVGAAVASLITGLMVMLARATQQAQWEHDHPAPPREERRIRWPPRDDGTLP